MFKSFSNQWLHAKLTHHVSLTAANAFWKLSFQYVGRLLQMKIDQNIKRKIPQFPQVKKVLYKNMCPDVKMSCAFLDKTNNSITHIAENDEQFSIIQGDANYQKLYEEAHIEVRYCLNIPKDLVLIGSKAKMIA